MNIKCGLIGHKMAVIKAEGTMTKYGLAFVKTRQCVRCGYTYRSNIASAETPEEIKGRWPHVEITY